MATRSVVTTLSRTAVAIAALMIAIAATVGVGVMVDSFRATVQVWLGYSLQADVYVQPPSLVFRRSDASLEPGVVERLKNAPGVAGAYSVRSVRVTSNNGPTDLVAIDQGPNTRRTFRFKEGDMLPSFDGGAEVIVSEPYSYRFGVALGDSVRLQTDRGEHAFPVAGIFYDYGSDLGVVMMSRATYTRFYEDRGIAGLALYATPGQDVDALVQDLRERVGDEQEVLIRSNRALRETSLAIFDRTFTVTIVLRLLAVLVAFVGVLSALMALQLERARELAVLRANGLTPRQVWRYVTMQTGLMGLMAGLLSLPLGLTLAYVLIHVINKRSFGWTLQVDVSPEILAQALVLALVAALLAGLYPAWKMARANPAMALREE
jgi:putative ABC transport system permease protein